MEEQLRLLLIRFLNNQCTRAEEQHVHQLLEQPEILAYLYQLMEEQDRITEQEIPSSEAYQLEKMESWQKRIHQRLEKAEQVEQQPTVVFPLKKSNWFRYAAVFIGFIFLAGSSWFLFDRTMTGGNELALQEDILPGGDKAILTLVDGSVISLSEAQSGTLASQQGVQIEKTKEGNIVYHTGNSQQVQSLAQNTISTPKGGQYRITLPDGSKAWLNAASSLTYPVQFDGKERRVKMTGEVYFEIAKVTDIKRKRIPFFVETDKQEIQVLGTHFNVNAYKDENAVRTTLVEGSVKVKANGGQSTLLKPGQQAILAKQLDVQQADIQQQLAWKNGDFIFRGERLEDVLRQIARWYDVEVAYPKHLADVRFTGMVSRSQPLSMIREMIETTKKLKVDLKERRFTVTD